MPRKYSQKSQEEVAKAMHEMKRGQLRSGRVKNPKQAVAIGLSQARKKGARVPSPRRQPSGRKNKQKKGT
jgi:hypothetical protein